MPPEISPDIINAIVAIPAMLEDILAGKFPDPASRPWFRKVADNAKVVLTGMASDFRRPEDVRDALIGYLVAVEEKARPGRLLWPLTRDQWRTEQWSTHGVYERDVVGSREIYWNGLLLRELSGERRHLLISEFEREKDVSRLLHSVVRHGVRDPLEPRRPYWKNESEIAELPSSLVSAVATVILALSSPDAPEDWSQRATVYRGLPDGRSEWDNEDIRFLLRRTGQSPRPQQDPELKYAVVAEWLHEELEYWRNLVPDADKGEQFFNVIGEGLKRAYLHAERGYTKGQSQYESPYPSGNLEFHWIRRAGLDPRASERFDSVDSNGVDLAEDREIDAALLPAGSRPRKNPETVPQVGHWMDGRGLRGEFVESVQVERDIDLAFRATGADVVLDRREREIFKAYFLSGARWKAVEGMCGVTSEQLSAAKRKLIPGRSQKTVDWLCAAQEWLGCRYPDRRRANRTAQRVLWRCLARRRIGAGRRTEVPMEGGSVNGEELLRRVIARLRKPLPVVEDSIRVRPSFLDGCRLPSMDISHTWGARSAAELEKTNSDGLKTLISRPLSP